jgi:hypothetical protein
VQEAIREARESGIKVVMITGDSKVLLPTCLHKNASSWIDLLHFIRDIRILSSPEYVIELRVSSRCR